MIETAWTLAFTSAELSALLENNTHKKWLTNAIREALDLPQQPSTEVVSAGVESLLRKGYVQRSALGGVDEEKSDISWFLPFLWDSQDMLSFIMVGNDRHMTGVSLRSKEDRSPVYIFSAGNEVFSSVPAVAPETRARYINYGELAGSVYDQFINLLNNPADGLAMSITYLAPDALSLINARYLPDSGWEVSVSKPDNTLKPDMMSIEVESLEDVGNIIKNGFFKDFPLS